MDTKIRSDKLRINQLSEKPFQWYLGYLKTIDDNDVKSYSSYLSDECTLLINNNPLVNGKDQIIKHLTSLWTSFIEYLWFRFIFLIRDNKAFHFRMEMKSL
jgi:ketosteroid isomerase-like protein